MNLDCNLFSNLSQGLSQILQNSERGEWLSILEAQDKSGEVLAIFLETIISNVDQVRDRVLIRNIISVLEKKNTNGELSQKTQDIFFATRKKYEQLEKMSLGHFSDCPPEILTYITTFIQKPIDLGNFIVTNHNILNNLGRFLANNKPLTSLFLKHYLPGNLKNLPDSIQNNIKMFSHIITELDFSDVDITKEDMEKIVELYPDLQTLKLSSSTTDEVLQPLQNLKKLKNLNLYGGEDITGNTFHCLPENLEMIRFCTCKAIDEKELEKLFGKLPKLTVLDLSFCSQLTGDAFKALPTTIKDLDISRCSGITEENLEIAFGRCPDLVSLNLSFCPQSTGIALRALPSKIEKILLGSTSITEKNLQIGIQNWTNLQVLDLSYMEKLTGNALTVLPSTMKDLILTSCTGISDHFLKMALERTPDLDFLALYGCDQYTGDFFSVTPNSLKKLYLSGCFGIQDMNLEIGLARCPFLEEFSLHRCDQLTGDGLKKLSKTVKDLDLFRCAKIKQENVELVLKNCRNLTNLVLSDCTQLTGSLLRLIPEAIKWLYIHGCTAMSMSEVAEAQNKLKNSGVRVFYGY